MAAGEVQAEVIPASHQGSFRVAEMLGQEVGIAVDAQMVESSHLFVGNLRGAGKRNQPRDLGLAALALVILNLRGLAGAARYDAVTAIIPVSDKTLATAGLRVYEAMISFQACFIWKVTDGSVSK